MSQLGDIEKAIVDRLTAKLKARPEGKGVEVELYPDRPDSYAPKGRGALLIGYGQSDYGGIGGGDTDDGDSGAFGTVVRPRHMTFVIAAVTRDLGARTTATDLMEAARLILTGWRPPHCTTPLIPLTDGLVAAKQGKWVFELTVRASGLAVAEDDGDDQTAPPIAGIVFETTGGPNG